ncbi:TetR family transcriptional regulator [Prauserella marina]|uniref:DNA-binding transcriptional regulator, AcrR family n=1 Tax=Prauserella marina TaxID=530584 RepID=A0A222VW70_9PSEU|nr:TetR/AcrR family transcriptional regulator [Prauserella marina]ASR38157.1 TetR family transcriptional regulator [Prauserella marina]PWV78671.1 TetR family transcriptional regulator [Prauserella marina]SDC91194.1 DNA-binding transcriptional regulator, AcrR family [Prauserella marina]
MAVTTRERVKRAAVKLFADKGFHGTGIRDLAQEAKLSSASLYHYMGTKEELLAEIMRDSLGALLESAKQAVADVTDPRQRLSRLVALHVTTHARQPKETRVVDHEIGVLSPKARRTVVGLRDEYERLWSDAIADGVREGVFDTAEPTITRIALLEMCNGVARWYSPKGTLGLDALAGHYVRLAMRALGVSDGRHAVS